MAKLIVPAKFEDIFQIHISSCTIYGSSVNYIWWSIYYLLYSNKYMHV